MSDCTTCGRDHAKLLRESAEDHANISKAYNKVLNTDPEEFLPYAVSVQAGAIALDQNKMIAAGEAVGISKEEAERAYAATIFDLAFTMGVMCAPTFADRFPKMEPATEKEVADFTSVVDRITTENEIPVHVSEFVDSLRAQGVKVDVVRLSDLVGENPSSLSDLLGEKPSRPNLRITEENDDEEDD